MHSQSFYGIVCSSSDESINHHLCEPFRKILNNSIVVPIFVLLLKNIQKLIINNVKHNNEVTINK
jgi:hypothetical protein